MRATGREERTRVNTLISGRVRWPCSRSRKSGGGSGIDIDAWGLAELVVKSLFNFVRDRQIFTEKKSSESGLKRRRAREGLS